MASDLQLESMTRFTCNHKCNRGVGTSWEQRRPPTELEALDALDEIKSLLQPERQGPNGKRQTQKQYMASKVQGWSHAVLKNVQLFLSLFTGKKSKTKGQWTRSSEQAAASINRTSKNAPKALREHAKKFISTRKPPDNPYGTWTEAHIDADEEFAQEINLHLQSKGKYLKADDISVFLNTKDVQDKWGLKKSIGKATAKHWMRNVKIPSMVGPTWCRVVLIVY